MFHNIYTYLFNVPKTTKNQKQKQKSKPQQANMSETNMSSTFIETNENKNESFDIIPYSSKKRKPRKKTFQRKMKEKAAKKHKRRVLRNAERVQRMIAEGTNFGYDNNEDLYLKAEELLDTHTNEDYYYNKKEEWVINNNNKIKHSNVKFKLR
jgi:hypothetical protein